MRASNRHESGFTLIELMITVAIIGILAASAATGYNFFQLRTRRAEATGNLASVKTAQLSYFHEATGYIVAVPSPGMALGPQKQNWTGLGSFSAIPGTGFDVLGWVPEGATFYDYDTNAAPGPNGWAFTAAAYGDNDGDGAISAFLYVHPDTAGGTLPSFLGGFTTTWEPGTCNVLTDTVRQVHWNGGCGFPAADDY